MVNTFILTDSPVETMKLLDTKRLGKQRVEAFQILSALKVYKENEEQEEKKTIGYINHPIVKMWIGYTDGLKYYLNCAIDEWISRGYVNNMLKYDVDSKAILPWWVYNRQVQLSHIASLLRKDPKHYRSLQSEETEDYLKTGYIWTCNLSEDYVSKLKIGETCNLEKVCTPIGTGAPAQYRYTKEDVDKWIENKNINPKTGRGIKQTGSIYKDLEKASSFYKV